MTKYSPLLQVNNLGLAFGQHKVMTDLSFDVGQGETVALVGESGSGKSATALGIMRLIEREGGSITNGTISLNDKHGSTELSVLSDRQMRAIRGNRIAMIFQEPMTALNPVMTLGYQVSEVLTLHRGLRGNAARKAVIEAFDRVHIPLAGKRIDQYPHELSGGMRQRVMIAMALACQPALLIGDEPTTALDVTTQAEILKLIRELQTESGMGVVFITHDMGVVAEMADSTVVLCRGKPVETARTAALFAYPREQYTRALLAAAPVLGTAEPVEDKGIKLEHVLDVKQLYVRFPVKRGFSPLDYHAVNGVDLRVHKGETLGLVGESGCGKSSLARAIAQLIPSHDGEIHLKGEKVTGKNSAALRPLRKDMQMIFQDPYASLNPRMPVSQLITEPARIAGLVQTAEEIRDLAAQLLARVQLPEDAIDRFAHQFSGGQRQRLCIARALSARPSLIIADEAVSALDATVGRQITDLLAQIQAEEGMSCLFISHDLAVIERTCHRVAVMFAGQIVETGPTRDVLLNPVHPYTRRLLSAVPQPDPSRRRTTPHDLPAVMERPDLLLHPAKLRVPIKLQEYAPNHFVAADALERAKVLTGIDRLSPVGYRTSARALLSAGT